MTTEGIRLISPPDLDVHYPHEVDAFLSDLPDDYPFGQPAINIGQNIEAVALAIRKLHEARGAVIYNASELKRTWAKRPEAFDKLSPEQRAKAMEIISRLASSESE